MLRLSAVDRSSAVSNLDKQSQHQTQKNDQINEEGSEREAAADCGCDLASQLNDGIYPEDCWNVTWCLDPFGYEKQGL